MLYCNSCSKSVSGLWLWRELCLEFSLRDRILDLDIRRRTKIADIDIGVGKLKWRAKYLYDLPGHIRLGNKVFSSGDLESEDRSRAGRPRWSEGDVKVAGS